MNVNCFSLKKNFAKPKGLSLVEVMVAVSIFGILAVATAWQLGVTSKTVQRTQMLQETMNIDREIDNLMVNRNHCLQSLQGVNLNTNKDELTSIDALYYAVPNPSLPGSFQRSETPLISNNSAYGNLMIQNMALRVVHQLNDAPNQYLVEMSYEASMGGTGGHTLGSSPSRFVVQTDSSNAVEDCYSSLDGSIALGERLCEIDGGGDYFYNATTGNCESRYNEEWYDGDNTTASCPSGWSPAWDEWSCGAYSTSNWEDAYATIDRTYEGNLTDSARPDPYVTSMTGTTCNCYYATDLPPEIKALFVCEVYCRQN